MKKQKVIAVIPARYNSTRLPAKPLADINGKPLIYYVWKGAAESQLIDRLVIATDDERIENACKDFGAEVVMTPEYLASGSDRVLYVYNKLGLGYDYILNIQGDEPLINGNLLDNLIENTVQSGMDVGTVVNKIETYDDLFDHSVVKVVMGNDSRGIYFSRAPVPFQRDVQPTKWLSEHAYWKHIGLYLYKKSALVRFGELPQCALEKMEKLEQLRLLDDGASYFCFITDFQLMGIDTPEDLEKLRKKIQKDLS